MSPQGPETIPDTNDGNKKKRLGETLREKLAAQQEHEVQDIDTKIEEMKSLAQNLERSQKRTQKSIREMREEQGKLKTSIQEIKNLFEEYKLILAKEKITSHEELLKAKQYADQEEVMTVKNLEKSYNEKQTEAREQVKERGRIKDEVRQAVSDSEEDPDDTPEGGEEDEVRQTTPPEEEAENTSEEDKTGERTFKKIIVNVEKKIQDLEEEREELHSKTPEGRKEKEEREKEEEEEAEREALEKFGRHINYDIDRITRSREGGGIDLPQDIVGYIEKNEENTMKDFIVENYLKEKRRRIEEETFGAPDGERLKMQKKLEEMSGLLEDFVAAILDYSMTQKMVESHQSKNEKTKSMLEFIEWSKPAIAEARKNLRNHLQTRIKSEYGMTNLVRGEAFYPLSAIDHSEYATRKKIEDENLEKDIKSLEYQIKEKEEETNIFGKRTKKIKKELEGLITQQKEKEQRLSELKEKLSEDRGVQNQIKEAGKGVVEILNRLPKEVPDVIDSYKNKETTVSELLNAIESDLRKIQPSRETMQEYAEYQRLKEDSEDREKKIYSTKENWTKHIASNISGIPEHIFDPVHSTI